MSKEYDLKWWMDDRRAELDMTLDDLARESGVSRQTLGEAGHGRPQRPKTKKGIERALRWERGSVDAILAGGEPTIISADDPEPSYDERLDALEVHARETLEQIEAMRRERSRPQRRTAR